MSTSSITVSVTLDDQTESVIFAQFLQVLQQHRAAQAQLAPQGPTSAWTPPAAEPKDRARDLNAAYAEAAKDETFVAEQVAIAEGTPVVADISPDSVERQFRAYAAKAGAGAARKLLDKYNAPYLNDVPAERLSAFVAELGR